MFDDRPTPDAQPPGPLENGTARSENPAPAANAAASPPATGESGAEAAHARADDAGLHHSLAEPINIVLTALILAFVFRAFLVEAFIIPTGSMAESLLGAHTTITCSACGWTFDVSLRGSPSGQAIPPTGHIDSVCPNCHIRRSIGPNEILPKSGDRILVHKWPYLLGGWFGPRRWDVIVFRDPADADTNFIKRLVGLPGESLELLDGDLYVDGRIARKPDEVQQALWFVVFDQSHQPILSEYPRWRPRWLPLTANRDPASSGWSGFTDRIVHFRPPDDQPHTLRFHADVDHEYLTDFYGYNRGSSGRLVGDVRLSFDLLPLSSGGEVDLAIDRSPQRFSCRLTADGQARLLVEPSSGGEAPREIASGRFAALAQGVPAHIEFAHVDCAVWLRVDGRFVCRAYYAPDVESLRSGPGRRPVSLQVDAQAAAFDFLQLRVDRDIHYTTTPGRTERADPGHPFTLAPGEYFVLGDNSPDSFDSREWTECAGYLFSDLAADRYHIGTVRADQIVGRAAFVYLPGLLRSGADSGWRLPDIGRMRFIR